jgi:hypothetical protein
MRADVARHDQLRPGAVDHQRLIEQFGGKRLVPDIAR